MQNCGDCTMCCTLLQLNEIPSAIGETCQHCTSGGCGIYENRPNECKVYQCMWSQMPDRYASIALRPDKCGILFDRQSQDVIAARLKDNGVIGELLMGQIDSFNKEGFSVIVFRGKDKKHFLTNSHTIDYVERTVFERSEYLKGL